MMTEPAKEPVMESPALTVLFDGGCPLCRREIGIYRGLQPLRPGAPVCFADISDAALPLPPGTTREQLLARFHVRGRDGELLSGAQAFLALALGGRLPGVAWMMERGYRIFLRWRPTLQRWAFRLDPPGLERNVPERPNSDGNALR
jgi:predicted DCC family thiol-disulfide oxidoreductase YuxK